MMSLTDFFYCFSFQVRRLPEAQIRFKKLNKMCLETKIKNGNSFINKMYSRTTGFTYISRHVAGEPHQIRQNLGRMETIREQWPINSQYT